MIFADMSDPSIRWSYMLVAVLASDTVENGTTEEINDMLELPCASNTMVQGKVPKARP